MRKIVISGAYHICSKCGKKIHPGEKVSIPIYISKEPYKHLECTEPSELSKFPSHIFL